MVFTAQAALFHSVSGTFTRRKCHFYPVLVGVVLQFCSGSTQQKWHKSCTLSHAQPQQTKYQPLTIAHFSPLKTRKNQPKVFFFIFRALLSGKNDKYRT